MSSIHAGNTPSQIATMPKPNKAELKKYRALLVHHLAVLRGDVGSMKDEALRASDQDASVDHLADQGTDNYDQGFLLGLIENEEVTIQLIEEAIQRIDGGGDFPFGACVRCHELATDAKERDKDKDKGKDKDKAKKVRKVEKIEPWIPKERLGYIPWARYCVAHQEETERNREIA